MALSALSKENMPGAGHGSSSPRSIMIQLRMFPTRMKMGIVKLVVRFVSNWCATF